MGNTGNDKHISKDEMKSFSDVFSNCAVAAKDAGQAIYNMETILNGCLYEGKAQDVLPETIECMYSGLLRLSYLYEELSKFIEMTTDSFVNVDTSARDAANEVIETE